jgi:hypothetical protein
MQRLATRNPSHTDLEAVIPDPTDVALAEVRAPVANVALARRLGVGDPDGLRRLDSDGCRSCLGDEGVAVEEEDTPVVAFDRQRAIERRWQSKRHLDLGGVDERGETAARVASVRRRERPSIAPWQDDLHVPETS